jgi:hypothetical protein
MVQIILSYLVLAILSFNLVKVLRKYLLDLGEKAQKIGIAIFIVAIAFLLIVFKISYTRDAILILQFFVFLYDANRGELYKKAEKNFYDLTFYDKFYLVAYNLFFVSGYFVYMLYSFPIHLSSNMQPIGNAIVLFVIIYLVFMDRRKKRKSPMFYGNKKKTVSI